MIDLERRAAPFAATLYMLAAMAFFASMSGTIRLSTAELDPLQVVFFRNFLALPIMLPWLLRHGGGALKTKRFGLYSLRAGINIVGMAAGFTAVTLIPLAEATALSFTAPLFATIGAALVLGEVVRARRITALVVGFVGVVVVLRPGVDSGSLGALLALVNAFSIAITTLIVKSLTRTESAGAIVTWMALLHSVLSLIPALFVWQWPSAEIWLWLVLLAGAGTLGHLCFTQAFARAEVTQIQPLEFVRLPLVAVMAFVVFDEVPTIWTWLGGVVIFASTAYITHREARSARLAVRNHSAD